MKLSKTDRSNIRIAELLGIPFMVWNDSDPIDGNDYRVVHYAPIEGCNEGLVQYNGGASEAQVFNHELTLLSLDYHCSMQSILLAFITIKNDMLLGRIDAGGDPDFLLFTERMDKFIHADNLTDAYKCLSAFANSYLNSLTHTSV